MIRSISRRWVLPVLLIGALGTTPACSPYLVRDLANAAVLTAVIVGTAHLLAHHEAHMHHEHCGHRRRWHQGHWTYYYGGHWEYYEPQRRGWYYYEDREGYEGYDYGEY